MSRSADTMEDTGSWFPVPDEGELPDGLRGLFAKARERLGFVPNVFRVYAFRPERLSAYIRLIWICAVGLAGILYLLLGAKYPAWMRVEQVLQGIVLITLLIALTRKPVRDRFAKQQFG